jgi:hypothetical protein
MECGSNWNEVLSHLWHLQKRYYNDKIVGFEKHFAAQLVQNATITAISSPSRANQAPIDLLKGRKDPAKKALVKPSAGVLQNKTHSRPPPNLSKEQVTQ